MANKDVQETEFELDDFDNKLIQEKKTSDETEPTEPASQKKKNWFFDLIAIMALIFAILALIIVVVLLFRNFNQSLDAPTHQAASLSDFLLLQNSIRSIQSHVNKSLKHLQTRVNSYKKDKIAELELWQEDFKHNLQLIQLNSEKFFQDIASLKRERKTSKVGLENFELEFLKIDNLTSIIDVKLSTLSINISENTDDLQTISNNAMTISTGTLSRPALSCKQLSQQLPSGNYWIQTSSLSSPVSVYCDTSRTTCSSCSGTVTGGWTRVANFDMTDSSQRCPFSFMEINRSQSPRRTCGRPSGTTGCISTTYPVYGIKYSRVCGRIVGYQIGSPSGFDTGSNSINSHYIAGISLTHGTPRQHIWSLVNAQGEGYTGEVCPCISGGNTVTPFFVGNDYFCDTAIRGSNAIDGRFYPSDPLWDGQGCGFRSTCCQFNNPPWFCKQLPQPTTDDIELRLCENSGPDNDDTPIEVVELYIN